ncbi:Acetylxylan esterase precursor [Planctomycetes bacterium MalM25]|nr:Acetylxylan esterase precursor [Planctomycetes bacterium MalM25]
MNPLPRLLFLIAMASTSTHAGGEPNVSRYHLLTGEAAEAGDEGGATYEQRGDAQRSSRWATGVTDPIVTVYRPEADLGSRAAVIVFPGGGYSGLAIDKEGHFVARWLAERGLVGVLVPYRCGGGEHQHPVPQADAARAVRWVRANARRFDIDPERVGVLGFSAGGHLAASTATLHGSTTPKETDPALAAFSARPDFAVLVYPAISFRDDVGHRGSRTNLIGKDPGEEEIALLSTDEQVTADTPPTLLIHAIDDPGVPVENSQRFYDACRRHGVPVEMHLYETGGHGFGMWAPAGSVTRWPAALEAWLVGRGLAETR